mgnify:CR=1 FL=1
MIDILSIAVWAAIKATPRTMHEWTTTEYAFTWMYADYLAFPSVALVDMEVAR